MRPRSTPTLVTSARTTPAQITAAPSAGVAPMTARPPTAPPTTSGPIQVLESDSSPPVSKAAITATATTAPSRAPIAAAATRTATRVRNVRVVVTGEPPGSGARGAPDPTVSPAAGPCKPGSDRLEQQHINPYTVPGLLPGLLGLMMILLGTILALRSWRRGALSLPITAPIGATSAQPSTPKGAERTARTSASSRPSRSSRVSGLQPGGPAAGSAVEARTTATE